MKANHSQYYLMLASGALAVLFLFLFVHAILFSVDRREILGTGAVTVLQLVICFGARRRLKAEMAKATAAGAEHRRPRDWMGNPLK